MDAKRFFISLKEKIVEGYYRCEDKWFDGLDFLDGRGIPIYKVIDPLEKRGIPTFPIFIALVIILLYFLIMMLLGVGGAGMVNFSIHVVDSNTDIAIDGADIALLQNDEMKLIVSTDENGFANATKEAGTYEIRVKKKSKGCEEYNEDVTVVEGIVIKIELEGCSEDEITGESLCFEPDGVGTVSVKAYKSGFLQKTIPSCGYNKCSFTYEGGYTYEFVTTGHYVSEDRYASVQLQSMENAGICIDMKYEDPGDDPTITKGKVVVYVKRDDDTPVTGVTVKLVNHEDADGIIATDITGYTGAYAGMATFEEKNGTKFRIFIESGENTSYYKSNVTYTFTEETQFINITVNVSVPTLIRVIDTDTKQGIGNVLVRIFDKSVTQVGKDFTDSTGETIIGLNAEEPYRGTFWRKQYKFRKADITGGKDTLVEMTKQPSHEVRNLQLKVMFKSLPDGSGSLVPEATAILIDNESMPYLITDIYRGYGVFEWVEPGTYEIKVSRPKGPPTIETVIVETDKPITRKTIVIDPIRYNVNVNVSKPDGTPAVEAHVTLYAEVAYPDAKSLLDEGPTWGDGTAFLTAPEQLKILVYTEYIDVDGTKETYIDTQIIKNLDSDTDVIVQLKKVDTEVAYAGAKYGDEKCDPDCGTIDNKMKVGDYYTLLFDLGLPEIGGELEEGRWDNIQFTISNVEGGIEFPDDAPIYGPAGTPGTEGNSQTFTLQREYTEQGTVRLYVPIRIEVYNAEKMDTQTINYKAVWDKGVKHEESEGSVTLYITSFRCISKNGFGICTYIIEAEGMFEIMVPPNEVSVERGSNVLLGLEITREADNEYMGNITVSEDYGNGMVTFKNLDPNPTGKKIGVGDDPYVKWLQACNGCLFVPSTKDRIIIDISRLSDLDKRTLKHGEKIEMEIPVIAAKSSHVPTNLGVHADTWLTAYDFMIDGTTGGNVELYQLSVSKDAKGEEEWKREPDNALNPDRDVLYDLTPGMEIIFKDEDDNVVLFADGTVTGSITKELKNEGLGTIAEMAGRVDYIQVNPNRDGQGNEIPGTLGYYLHFKDSGNLFKLKPNGDLDVTFTNGEGIKTPVRRSVPVEQCLDIPDVTEAMKGARKIWAIPSVTCPIRIKYKKGASSFNPPVTGRCGPNSPAEMIIGIKEGCPIDISSENFEDPTIGDIVYGFSKEDLMIVNTDSSTLDKNGWIYFDLPLITQAVDIDLIVKLEEGCDPSESSLEEPKLMPVLMIGEKQVTHNIRVDKDIPLEKDKLVYYTSGKNRKPQGGFDGISIRHNGPQSCKLVYAELNITVKGVPDNADYNKVIVENTDRIKEEAWGEITDEFNITYNYPGMGENENPITIGGHIKVHVKSYDELEQTYKIPFTMGISRPKCVEMPAMPKITIYGKKEQKEGDETVEVEQRCTFAIRVSEDDPEVTGKYVCGDKDAVEITIRKSPYCDVEVERVKSNFPFTADPLVESTKYADVVKSTEVYYEYVVDPNSPVDEDPSAITFVIKSTLKGNELMTSEDTLPVTLRAESVEIFKPPAGGWITFKPEKIQRYDEIIKCNENYCTIEQTLDYLRKETEDFEISKSNVQVNLIAYPDISSQKIQTVLKEIITTEKLGGIKTYITAQADAENTAYAASKNIVIDINGKLEKGLNSITAEKREASNGKSYLMLTFENTGFVGADSSKIFLIDSVQLFMPASNFGFGAGYSTAIIAPTDTLSAALEETLESQWGLDPYGTTHRFSSETEAGNYVHTMVAELCSNNNPVCDKIAAITGDVTYTTPVIYKDPDTWTIYFMANSALVLETLINAFSTSVGLDGSTKKVLERRDEDFTAFGKRIGGYLTLTPNELIYDILSENANYPVTDQLSTFIWEEEIEEFGEEVLGLKDPRSVLYEPMTHRQGPDIVIVICNDVNSVIGCNKGLLENAKNYEGVPGKHLTAFKDQWPNQNIPKQGIYWLDEGGIYYLFSSTYNAANNIENLLKTIVSDEEIPLYYAKVKDENKVYTSTLKGEIYDGWVTNRGLEYGFGYSEKTLKETFGLIEKVAVDETEDMYSNVLYISEAVAEECEVIDSDLWLIKNSNNKRVDGVMVNSDNSAPIKLMASFESKFYFKLQASINPSSSLEGTVYDFDKGSSGGRSGGFFSIKEEDELAVYSGSANKVGLVNYYPPISTAYMLPPSVEKKSCADVDLDDYGYISTEIASDNNKKLCVYSSEKRLFEITFSAFASNSVTLESTGKMESKYSLDNVYLITAVEPDGGKFRVYVKPLLPTVEGSLPGSSYLCGYETGESFPCNNENDCAYPVPNCNIEEGETEGTCAECSDDSDCGEKGICNYEGVCEPVDCKNDEHCGEGEVCNEATYKCESEWKPAVEATNCGKPSTSEYQHECGKIVTSEYAAPLCNKRRSEVYCGTKFCVQKANQNYGCSDWYLGGCITCDKHGSTGKCCSCPAGYEYDGKYDGKYICCPPDTDYDKFSAKCKEVTSL